MTAPLDWYALGGSLCRRDEDARAIEAHANYLHGDSSGPEAVELPPVEADVRYQGVWTVYLGRGEAQ